MTTAVEMMIEPGAETLLQNMGKQFGTKARSKVMNKSISHFRNHLQTSDLVKWFREDWILPSRRTTVRISKQNAEFASALAQMTNKGRPAILLGMVYLAACQLAPEDYEALR